MRGKGIAVALSITIACVACIAVVFIARFRRPLCWNVPAEIQVLASANELWLFVGNQRLIGHISGSGADAEPRPRGSVGSLLCVVRIADGQVRQRVELMYPPVASIHPNIGQVFVSSNEICLFLGQSLDKGATILKWNGHDFEPTDKNAHLLTAETVDASTEANGWTRLLGRYGKRSFSAGEEESLRWRGEQVMLRRDIQKDKFAYTVEGRPIGGHGSVVVEFGRDLAPATREELSRVTYQVP